MFPGTSEWLPAMFRGTVLLSAAACVVGALIWALRIRAANLRWRAWFAVLVCGLGFVPLTVQLPWREANAPPALTADRVADIALPRTVELNDVPGEQESPDSEVADETEFEPIDEPEVPAAQAIAPTLQVVEAAPNEPSAASSWPRALLGVWLAGMIAIFARGVWRYGRFLRSLRHCVAAPSEWANAWRTLLGEARVRRDVPMLVGEHYGPALCRLPRGYALVVPRTMWERTPANARDIILRHELAHYLRNDLTWSLIARWLAAPHWLNPLAHLAVRRLDEASEWACDDDATGGRADRQLLLSKTLLELSESSGAPGAMQAAVNGNVLALRIRRLLEPALLKERIMKRVLVATASFLCLIAAGVRFELVAQEAKPPVEEFLQEAGVVSGVLIDAADGKPVAGAHVLIRGDELKTTSSDEEGRFRFEQLPSSSQDYELWAYRENHTTDRIQVRQLPGGDPAAARFAPLRLEMKPGMQARFAVVSQETGAAIAGAMVRVGYPDRRTDTTNEGGIVNVLGLLPREYYVTVQMKGYAQSTPQIDLQGRDGMAQYDVALSPGGEIHGIAVDEQGQPVPDASINYFIGSNGNGYYGVSPRTDVEGKFQHSFLPLDVPVGVSVHADGYLPSRQDVSVTAEQRVRELRVSLSKRPLGGSIAGVVRDQAGKPVANAQVANYGDSSTLERLTTTNEAGRFVLHGLFESYAGVSVNVSARGFTPQRVPVKPGTAAAPTELTITLEPGHAIRGQIVNEAGKPVGGVYVMARSGAFRHGMEAIRADEQGAFSFDSLPADVLFQFGYPEFAYTQNMPLTLDGVDPVTVTLADPGVIRGHILNSESKLPVTQFRIRLGPCRDRTQGDVDGMYSGEWANPGLTFQAVDGRFNIGPLTARFPVELTIEADGYERLLVPRVVAAKAEVSEELSISLRPMAPEGPYALTTQLLNSDGQPLPKVELRLIVSTNRPAGADDKEFNWALIDSGQLGQMSYVEQYLHGITDAEGKYEFKNILPGRYLQLAYWGPQVPKGWFLAFEVTRSGESDSVVIEAPRPAVVRGTMDRSKFPDAGRVRLSSTARSFLQFQSSLADDQSTFELRDLPPGEFWISVDAKPVRFTENGHEFSRIAPLASKKLVLKAGEAIEVKFDVPDEAK